MEQLRRLLAIEKRRGLDRLGIERLRRVMAPFMHGVYQMPEGELVYEGFFLLGVFGPRYFSRPAEKHAPETA